MSGLWVVTSLHTYFLVLFDMKVLLAAVYFYPKKPFSYLKVPIS